MPEGRALAEPLGDARLEGGSGAACAVLPGAPGCWQPDKDRV